MMDSQCEIAEQDHKVHRRQNLPNPIEDLHQKVILNLLPKHQVGVIHRNKYKQANSHMW
jgi:hypothetical protein